MSQLTDHKVLILDVYGTLAVRFHPVDFFAKFLTDEELILLKIGLGNGFI